MEMEEMDWEQRDEILSKSPAKISATCSAGILEAISPRAQTDKYAYEWKIFQNGSQVGESHIGTELTRLLAKGKYRLHLIVYELGTDRAVDTATVSVFAND